MLQIQKNVVYYYCNKNLTRVSGERGIFMENKKKLADGLKALFIVVGAVVTIAAVLITLYNIFKKYFKISFECNTGNVYDCFDGACDDCEPEISFCDCGCSCDSDDELFEAEEL